MGVLSTPRRTGLHRLLCLNACELPPVYTTVAGIERGPLPACGACGERMCPENFHLATEVLPEDAWETHPAWAEYTAEWSSVAHGQAPHYARMAREGREMKSTDGEALARVEARFAEITHARRCSGLHKGPADLSIAARDASDTIPF